MGPAFHGNSFLISLYNSSGHRLRLYDSERTRNKIRHRLKELRKLWAFQYVHDLLFPIFIFSIQRIICQYAVKVLQTLANLISQRPTDGC